MSSEQKWLWLQEWRQEKEMLGKILIIILGGNGIPLAASGIFCVRSVGNHFPGNACGLRATKKREDCDLMFLFGGFGLVMFVLRGSGEIQAGHLIFIQFYGH